MNAELRNVTKTDQRIQAPDEIPLEIAPGQLVAVLGANGAGKTTWPRCTQ